MTGSEKKRGLLLQYMYAEIAAARSLLMEDLLQQSSLHVLRAWHGLVCIEALDKEGDLPALEELELDPEALPVADKISKDLSAWEQSLATVRRLAAADLATEEAPAETSSRRARAQAQRQLEQQIGLVEQCYRKVFKTSRPPGVRGLLMGRGKLLTWFIVVGVVAVGLAIYFTRVSDKKIQPAAAGAAHTPTAAEPMPERKNETVKLAQVSSPKEAGAVWDAPGNVMFKEWVKVELPAASNAAQVEVSVDNNDDYSVSFFNGDKNLGTATITRFQRGAGLRIAKVKVPEAAIKAGYDAIKLVAVKGDDAYSLGHMLLVK